jgi:mRNA interferase RelE/StbE
MVLPSDHFKRDFQTLPETIKRSAEKALRLILTNPISATLLSEPKRAKKMEGQLDAEGRKIWEARLTRGYRFTFVIDGDTYILRRVGSHDETLRRP